MASVSSNAQERNLESDSARPPKPARVDVIVENIPAKLAPLPRWVVWRYEFVEGKKGKAGKWTKVPVNPRTGGAGDTSKPNTWGTLKQALATAPRFDGIGFVLVADDDLVGADLDGCIREDGTLETWAQEIVAALPSVWEITPSGRGLRGWLRGKLPPKGRKKAIAPGQAIEFYETGRYLTCTGRRWHASADAIADRSAELVAVHGRIFGPKKPKPKAPTRSAPAGPLDLSDEKLLDKARAAKNGHGAKFAALFDSGDTGDYNGDVSTADFALACSLAFWTGKDAARMERLFDASALGQREKWKDRADYRQRTIANAIAATTETYSGQGRSAKGTGKATASAEAEGEQRPPVEISTQRHETVAAALATLPLDSTLFRRCERLVTVVEDTRTRVKVTKRTAIRQQEKTPRILELSTSVIGLALTRNGDWFQWKKDEVGEWIAVPAHPPDWAITAVATHGHYPGVRFLRAVAEAPFLRPDGSLVDIPGYDADTETLYIPSGTFPPIPRKPSQADAQAAARKLFDLVAQFPFVGDDHRVVWLAALLSVVGRPAITGPCPGVVFDANVAGTGKGLLAAIISLIATGRDAAAIGYPQDPAEMGKIITSVALAGYPMILLDNVPNGSKFGNDQLDRALTASVVDGRELGKSRMVGMLDLSTLWVLTGNNVSPTADAFRRWLPCRLESPLERPDRRDDLTIPDLPEHVREHRGALVAATLTILRAHAEAGWPGAGWAPLGSYAAWDRVVRAAVWFVTGRDCCATQDQLNLEDPERCERLALAAGWHTLPGGRTGLTSGEALEAVAENPGTHETLRAIFLEWGHKGEIATARTIGNQLKAIRGQNIGGFKFATSGDHRRSTRWKVVKIGCESGESGESVSELTRESLGFHHDVNECSENGKSQREALGSTHQTHQTHTGDADFLAEVGGWPARRQGRWSDRVAALIGGGVGDDAAQRQAYAELSDQAKGA